MHAHSRIGLLGDKSALIEGDLSVVGAESILLKTQLVFETESEEGNDKNSSNFRQGSQDF